MDNKLTVDEKIAKKELEEKLEKMADDKEAKCEAAKEQLVSMLEVTADKYRTATGTAEALRVIRFILGEEGGDNAQHHIIMANWLAKKMANVSIKMRDKAEKLDYAEMDKLCENFYAEDFAPSSEDVAMDLAEEMMRIDLCRNVGGAAEDMVSFIARVQEEIDSTTAELEKFESEEGK